jgi:hypothetical protein
MVLVMAAAPSTHAQPFTRTDLHELPDDAGPGEFEVMPGPFAVVLAEDTEIAWEMGDDRRHRRVADVRGDSAFHATVPYPVTVVPGALVI